MLARSLERNRQPGGPDCPDPAIMAAWFERSLPAAQARRVELHASSCARCQAVLAALTKTGEADDERAASGFSTGWRWLLIGTGLSAAIALLLIWIPSRNTPQQIAMETNPPAMKQTVPIAPGGAALAPAPEKNAPAAAAAIPERMASGAPPSNSTLFAPRAAMMAPQRGLVAERAPEVSRLASGAVNLKGAAAPQIAAESAASGGAGSMMASMFMFRSRTGSAAWGVGAGGWIESIDENGHGHPQISGVSADLLAGNAPSATVCWVVGRAGTVLRTLDGVHWEKISSPTKSDLIGVYAQSALVATVTAADGRPFVTTDGGSSWR